MKVGKSFLGTLTGRLMGRPTERRGHDRYSVDDIVLIVSGHRYRIENWSISGFVCSGFRRNAEVGQKIICVVDVPNGERRMPLPIEAMVVRSDKVKGVMAARFTKLGPLAERHIKRWFSERARKGRP